MNPLRKLRALLRRDKLERDMAEEMRFHLAQRAAEHVDDGLSAEEARGVGPWVLGWRMDLELVVGTRATRSPEYHVVG